MVMYARGTQGDYVALQLVQNRMVLNVNLGECCVGVGVLCVRVCWCVLSLWLFSYLFFDTVICKVYMLCVCTYVGVLCVRGCMCVAITVMIIYFFIFLHSDL